VAKSRRFGVGQASKFAKVFCFFFAKKKTFLFSFFLTPARHYARKRWRSARNNEQPGQGPGA
jgi:hypothetical protein